jgi:hypothetical protein
MKNQLEVIANVVREVRVELLIDEYAKYIEEDVDFFEKLIG